MMRQSGKRRKGMPKVLAVFITLVVASGLGVGGYFAVKTFWPSGLGVNEGTTPPSEILVDNKETFRGNGFEFKYDPSVWKLEGQGELTHIGDNSQLAGNEPDVMLQPVLDAGNFSDETKNKQTYNMVKSLMVLKMDAEDDPAGDISIIEGTEAFLPLPEK
jgi:hypothetical protein